MSEERYNSHCLHQHLAPNAENYRETATTHRVRYLGYGKKKRASASAIPSWAKTPLSIMTAISADYYYWTDKIRGRAKKAEKLGKYALWSVLLAAWFGADQLVF